MYEYLVTENRAGWQPWRERVPSWKYPRTQARADPFFCSLLVFCGMECLARPMYC